MPQEWDASRIRDRLLSRAEPPRDDPRARSSSDVPTDTQPDGPAAEEGVLVDEIRALRASMDEIRDLLRAAFANEQSAPRVPVLAGARPMTSRWPKENVRRGRPGGSTGAGRPGARTTLPPSPLLTTEELADRWRISTSSVLSRWRKGAIPSPTNPQQARNFRWARAVIEQFERGEWSADQPTERDEQSADVVAT